MSSFCKSHFFNKTISVYAIFDDQRFNDKLANVIVSFEQLSPVVNDGIDVMTDYPKPLTYFDIHVCFLFVCFFLFFFVVVFCFFFFFCFFCCFFFWGGGVSEPRLIILNAVSEISFMSLLLFNF